MDVGPTAVASWEEQFLELLQNRSKDRTRGFVALVRGPVSLAPVQRACSRQTYNRVLSARYRAGPGAVPGPLLEALRNDVSRTRALEGHGDEGEPVGTLEPDVSDSAWRKLASLLDVLGDGPLTTAEPLLAAFDKALEVGHRLVVLCELTDVPDDVSLDELGFVSEVAHILVERLPERVGLVLSGFPADMELTPLLKMGPGAVEIEIPPDASDSKPPERSQTLSNDQAQGDDQLQITYDVHALVDAIMAPDIQPPLVVGILGGWGSGKSFVLHLLKERLRQIRQMDVSDPESPARSVYVGHPYLIHFDAWTYAKADLWASLMQRVLFDLDRQLTLEQNLMKAGVPLEEGLDIWAIIDDLSIAQLESLGGELGQEALAHYEKWRRGEFTGRSVWSELRLLHEQELRALEEAEKRLETAVKGNRDARSERLAEIDAELGELERLSAERLTAELEQERKRIAETSAQADEASRRIEEEIAREDARRAAREGWQAVRGKLTDLFGRAMKDASPGEGDEVVRFGETVRGLDDQLGIIARWWAGRSAASIAFFLVAVAGAAVLALPQVQSALANLLGLVGTIGGALSTLHLSMSESTRKITGIQDEYERRRKAAHEENQAALDAERQRRIEAEVQPVREEVATLRVSLEERMEGARAARRLQLERQRQEKLRELARLESDHETVEAGLREEIEERRRRAGTVGRADSLHDLVRTRVQGGYYDGHLGLLHQVQCDLEELTDALMPRSADGADPAVFPRGDPRIVLVIDDLDRCPPPEVVKVLEAAQLLVKTRLFVVILAMDVRYVTRALEKNYEGILVSDGEPSGLDYIEKIVQIPYRVRPITRSAMEGYLQSQMDLRASAEGEAVEQVEQDQVNILFGGAGPPADITSPDAVRVNEALPPEVQFFETSELAMIRECALAVELSPRSTKRIVNVMKLVKNIWYRRAVPEPEEPVKAAIVLLLALAGGYPEVMRRVLLELERQMHGPTPLRVEELRTVLTRILKAWGNKGLPAADWASVVQLVADKGLLSDQVTVDQIGLANIELVRSFSFVGEVDRPPDAVTHELGVELRSPVEVRTVE